MPDSDGATLQISPLARPLEKPPELPREGDRREDPQPETARFPSGFLKGIDYLLHNPEAVMESLRRDADLWKLATIFFAISLAMSSFYGVVMGSTNLLQGSAMPLWAKLMMIWVTAVKVPALFLLTLAIVLPPVYVSNTFAGARLPLRQMVALLLAAVTITVTILASMSTVAFFFALTSTNYHFVKLLHVLIFAYAGTAGLAYLVRTLQGLSAPKPIGGVRVRHQTPQWLFVAWLLLYMFVGTQLAWVLRPFVGNPGEQFQIFRPRKGNFYESVYQSAKGLRQNKK